jgi:hypothetical protein
MTTSPNGGVILPWDIHHEPLSLDQAADLAFGPTTDRAERQRQIGRIRKWITRYPVTFRDATGWDADAGRVWVLGIAVLRAKAKAAERDPSVPRRSPRRAS